MPLRRLAGFQVFVMSEVEGPSFPSSHLSPGLPSSLPDSTGRPVQPSRGCGGADDGVAAGGALVNLSVRHERSLTLAWFSMTGFQGRKRNITAFTGCCCCCRLDNNEQNFRRKNHGRTPTVPNLR